MHQDLESYHENPRDTPQVTRIKLEFRALKQSKVQSDTLP